MTLHYIAAALPAVCPKAPGEAQKYVDDITSYVQWGVLALFTIGLAIGIGAIVMGRVMQSPHASKAGLASLIIVTVTAVGYVIVPSIVSGIIGSGCMGGTTV